MAGGPVYPHSSGVDLDLHRMAGGALGELRAAWDLSAAWPTPAEWTTSAARAAPAGGATEQATYTTGPAAGPRTDGRVRVSASGVFGRPGH